MSAAPRPNLEVADVFRGEAESFLRRSGKHLSIAQKRAFAAISTCRTAALGGHVVACDHCDHQRISYNSCRNRHCPKCQALTRAQWLERREAELLPIPYFHLVFTLPPEIANLAPQNKRLLYGMLFEAASRTIAEVAANPRHLGAHNVGILAVLHTWGQNLMHHPHLHCVVSGGGLATDGQRWVASKSYYFLPVRVLSRVFRRNYCQLLRHAYDQGQLEFHGQLAPLGDKRAFQKLLATAISREWVVYAKRPFGDPSCVLKYLARYTHRVAIANSRLVRYHAGRVTFRYKDYADHGRTRLMTLSGSEFIRRFLMHVLPKGFMRIRYFGYLANRQRQEKLAHCRGLLAAATAPPPVPDTSPAPPPPHAANEEHDEQVVCPACQQGALRIVFQWDRYSPAASHPPAIAVRHGEQQREDSS